MATSFKSIGQRVRSLFAAHHQRPLRKQAQGYRARLEMLEQRTLLSVNPAIGDVFYIDMENHNLTQPSSVTSPQQLLGNSAAPFLNSLMTPGNLNALQTSYASNYYNVLYNNPSASIHPSEPNYVWQEGGSNFGVANDADPYGNNGNPNPNLNNNVKLIAATGNNPANLSGLLQTAGISWKSYQEDIDLLPSSGSVNQPGPNALTSTVAPQSQWTVPTTSFSGTSAAYTNAYNGSDQYNFAVKHDGQLFYTDTNGGTLISANFSPSNPEAQHYSPLQQLQTDLNNNTVAQYNLITPDQYNDMHSSLNTNFTYNGVTYTHNTDQESVALGDNFLSQIIPQIEASQAYKNNGVIVIWYDETEAGNTTQFTVPEIVISPLAKGNAYDSTVAYTHSSDLKTMQELFGVSGTNGVFLGDANTPGTNDLADMFKSPAPGATQVNDALVLTGGSSNDHLNITPIGSSPTGSTGVSVSGTLNGVNINQTFTGVNMIEVSGGDGNDHFQFASSLTIATVISDGNGNDQIQLGNGNSNVTLGNGNDQVLAGNGNNVVTLGTGNDHVQLGDGTNTVTVGAAGSKGNSQVQLGNGAGNVVTVLGNGNDHVQAGDGAGDTVAITGNGNDQVQLGNGNNDAVTIVGNGNDQVRLGDGNDDSVAITGDGNDQVQIGNGTSDMVSIVGNGNDDVTTGTGSGTVHVAGTGHKNVHLGSSGWTQV